MKTLAVAVACVLLVFRVSPVMAKDNPTVVKTPTTDDVRQAVVRSLPFIEREGLAWMKNQACVTCHQIPTMLWTLNEGRRRQLPVDADKLIRWNEWALNGGLKRATYYKFTDETFSKLAKEGLPSEVLAKFEPVKDKNYVFEDEFRQMLALQLDPEQLAKYAEALIKGVAKGGQGGGGSSGDGSQIAALLLAGAPWSVINSAETHLALVAGLVTTQTKNGSWPASGQFLSQQRSKEEAIGVIAQWALLVLIDLPKPSDDVAKAIGKARGYLKSIKPGVSTESLILHAMLASREGQTALADQHLAELLNTQHADGGWSWVKGRAESDAFTTGMVLYALSYLRRDSSDPAVQKAWQYLLKLQGAGGNWNLSKRVISANKREDTTLGDAVYTYWATTWAVTGLLATLPD
jgi:hypothetical protein